MSAFRRSVRKYLAVIMYLYAYNTASSLFATSRIPYRSLTQFSYFSSVLYPFRPFTTIILLYQSNENLQVKSSTYSRHILHSLSIFIFLYVRFRPLSLDTMHEDRTPLKVDAVFVHCIPFFNYSLSFFHNTYPIASAKPPLGISKILV